MMFTNRFGIGDLHIASTMKAKARFIPPILFGKYLIDGEAEKIQAILGQYSYTGEKLKIPEDGNRFNWDDHLRINKLFPSSSLNILPCVEEIILRKKALVQHAIISGKDIFKNNPESPEGISETIRQRVRALFPLYTRKRDQHLIKHLTRKLKISRIKEDYLHKFLNFSLTLEDIRELSNMVRVNTKKLTNEYNEWLEQNGQGNKKIIWRPCIAQKD